MTIFSNKSYLQKHRYLPRLVSTPPPKELSMVVVIPCHQEERIERTLDSLLACHPPNGPVEVMIVVNASEKADPMVHSLNSQTVQGIQTWKQEKSPFFGLFTLHVDDLPHKHAGVGLARKIGMDEAIDRFEQAGTQEGILVCLDADSKVLPNYLVAIEDHFLHTPHSPAASLYFEHPTEGKAFEPRIYEGIVRYELFLRYYIEGLRYAGYPYAFHTIGSSMAVRSSAYQREGGMNRRKAGEDFYFLHKMMPLGDFSEINTTTVIPSPRPSHRVPFGTGRAILKWLEKPSNSYQAYHPAIFEDLRKFLQLVDRMVTEDVPIPIKSVQGFLVAENFEEKLLEMRKHTRSLITFRKRFFAWLDGLKVLKYVHFASEAYYPEMDLADASRQLYRTRYPGKKDVNNASYTELLQLFRHLQNPHKP